MDMPREVLRAMRDARKTRKADGRDAGKLVASRPSKKEREAAREAARERVIALNADLGKQYNARDRHYVDPWDGRAPKSDRVVDLASLRSATRIQASGKPRLHGGKWAFVPGQKAKK